MERTKAKEILSSRGWLLKLPNRTREDVLSRSVLVKFAKGETIYRLQDPPGGMYGLVSGTIGISIAPNVTGPYLAHYGRPGVWFGEAAVISGDPRRIGVAARTDVTTLHLPLPAISEIVEADPTFWRHLAMNAVLSLDLALRAYDDLKIGPPDMRIVAILLRLAGFPTDTFAGDEPARIEISQTELAEMANLSRTVVSRVLSSLSNDGLVSVGYRHIELRKPQRLAGLIVQQLNA